MHENQGKFEHVFDNKLNETPQLHLVIISNGSLNEAEHYNSNLRKLGFLLKSTRVETLQELSGKLEAEQYDIALCSLPELPIAVQEATQIITRSGQKIPVIGMMEEDEGVSAGEVLSAGAVDAVLKEDFVHLKLAVKREFNYLRMVRANDLLKTAYFESEKRSQTLLSSSRDAVAYVQEGMHVHTNQAYLELFGLQSLDDILGTPLMDMVTADNHQKLKQFIREHREGDGATQSISLTFQNTEGEEFKGTIEFTRTTIEGELGTQIIIRNRTDSKELNRQIQELVQKDPLTGLYTRQHLLKVLSEAIHQASNNIKAASCSLFLIRLESFDSENLADTPLQIKDNLLKTIAEALQSSKQDDEVFCILDEATIGLINPATDDKAINERARSLQKIIADQTVNHEQDPLNTSASMGVCIIDESTKETHEALSRAQRALSKALAKGQSTRIYRPKPGELTQRQLDQQWIKRISTALKSDHFIIRYQPIISLSSSECERYEIDPLLADVPGKEVTQSVFSPIALRTGMARGIDRWVIYRSFSLLAEKLQDKTLTVFFIPLSEAALNDPELFRWIKQLLKQFQLPASSVVFQFSEEAVLKHIKHARAIVSALRKIDCKICFDNFGAEANPFRLVRHVPVDYLKIHTSFMEGLSENRENQQVIEAISEKAHRFGQTTIASGINDAESLSVLWGLGVDLVQGDFLQETTIEMNYDFTAMMA